MGMRVLDGLQLAAEDRPPVCLRFESNLTAETRNRQGRFEVSTSKWRCLRSRCPKCYQNTRCCGLFLTRTMDSGKFSSAAVNRVLKDTGQNQAICRVQVLHPASRERVTE